MVTAGSSCVHCECPCAFDFKADRYLTGPCANPICSSWLDEHYCLKTTWSNNTPKDPDHWSTTYDGGVPTYGLMRNLVPHYWPLRGDLPRDGLISFQELMERECGRQASTLWASLDEPNDEIDACTPTSAVNLYVEETGDRLVVKKRVYPRKTSRSKLSKKRATKRGPYTKKAARTGNIGVV
jgi:hypothetical protein